jgi:hypothetical protein
MNENNESAWNASKKEEFNQWILKSTPPHGTVTEKSCQIAKHLAYGVREGYWGHQFAIEANYHGWMVDNVYAGPDLLEEYLDFSKVNKNDWNPIIEAMLGDGYLVARSSPDHKRVAYISPQAHNLLTISWIKQLDNYNAVIQLFILLMLVAPSFASCTLIFERFFVQ